MAQSNYAFAVMPEQPNLFELPEPELEAASVDEKFHSLSTKLSGRVRMGTMSWTFAGWRGLVYGPRVNVKGLADAGLTAYSKHPLLGAVEIDRSYYEPLSVDVYRRYASQVPEGFQFLVKAHEDCTVRRFPLHARYGKKRGEDNPRYLDAGYAAAAVVAPAVEGLGAKLGAILFQFSPEEDVSPLAFARQLRAFLKGLPAGVPYAVELRNPELFSSQYVAALADAGGVHCHNVWGNMPPILDQARFVPPNARRPLVIRWLLRQGDEYEAAFERMAPFDRLVEEDLATREAIARLVAKAIQHGVPVLVFVNNKAEGCAPESIMRLAQEIERLREPSGSDAE